VTNPIFGYPTATTYFTYGGGVYTPAYPLSNISNDDLDMVARTVDVATTSTFFYGQAPSQVGIGAVGLFNINLEIDAQIRLRFWDDAAMVTTPLLDTGNMPVYPGQRISDPHWFFWNGNNYFIRAFRIDITNTLNIENFIDIGRIEIAYGYEAPFGMSIGSQAGRQLRSGVSQTPGGMKFFRELDAPRVFKASFDADDDDMVDFYQEMLRIYDIHTPFIFIPHPDDPLRWNQTAMLGRFTGQSPMASFVQFKRSQISIDIEQVL
jgi:hypothetical protein